MFNNLVMLAVLMVFLFTVNTLFLERLSPRRVGWFALISLGWMVLLLVPYAVIGETWGMVWFLLTLPFSILAKETWETVGVTFYVALVTLLDGFGFFVFLSGADWLFDIINRNTPLSPAPQTAGAEVANADS